MNSAAGPRQRRPTRNSPPFDAVLGYHLGPHSCGIARFNNHLAGLYGIPFASILAPGANRFARPLVSIKLSEMAGGEGPLAAWIDSLDPDFHFALFLHAYDDAPLERQLVARATRVFCGNTEIAGKLAHQKQPVVDAYCPGAMDVTEDRFAPRRIEVFSFGMSNKIDTTHYARLRGLLDATGEGYCLYLSMALHEGSRIEDIFDSGREAFDRLFAPNLYFLGFLSDDAVAHYVRRADLFAAFFPGALRANNTSVNSAMAMGAAVITNLDRDSPAALVHGRNVIDINRCDDLAPYLADAGRIGAEARATVAEHYDWPGLVAILDAAGRDGPG